MLVEIRVFDEDEVLRSKLIFSGPRGCRQPTVLEVEVRNDDGVYRSTVYTKDEVRKEIDQLIVTPGRLALVVSHIVQNFYFIDGGHHVLKSYADGRIYSCPFQMTTTGSLVFTVPMTGAR